MAMPLLACVEPGAPVWDKGFGVCMHGFALV